MTIQINSIKILAMRLSPEQAQTIRQLAHEVVGSDARVRLFGSRLDDNARGGDVDLMLEVADPVLNPALIAARFSARVSRLLQGRRVDVLISAPNLGRFAIHDIAYDEGRLL
jgi:predicted nucleotidyltransferase